MVGGHGSTIDSSKVNVLLREKCQLIREMLVLTDNTYLAGDDDDAEKYVELMEKREEIMKKITMIDRQLGSPSLCGVKGGERLCKEAESLKKEIKDLACRIIRLDTEMQEAVLKITSELKRRMKDLNAGKNVSAAYQGLGYYASYGSGEGFDRRK